MTISCPIMDPPTANRKVVFVVRPMENTDLFMDRQDKALNMSKNTKQVNVIVVSRGVMMLSCTCGYVKGVVNSIHTLYIVIMMYTRTITSEPNQIVFIFLYKLAYLQDTQQIPVLLCLWLAVYETFNGNKINL